MKASGTSLSFSIASALLPTGDQLELIRSGDNSTSLLLWSGGCASRCREFRCGRRLYTPVEFGQALPHEITLATGISDYKSPAALFNGIAAVFKSSCGLDCNNADMATFFVFATHFAECRDPAPHAIVAGVDSWDVLQVLKLLGCFCRHALPAGIFVRADRPNLPAGCSPTFVISEARRSLDLLQFCGAARSRAFAITRSAGIVNRPFSAVIPRTIHQSYDTIPSTFCRINATQQTRPSLIDAKAFREIAETFQPQLLLYRLKNRSRVASETFDPDKLGGGTRALASVLGSCFPDSLELRKRVASLLEPQDEERRLSHARSESAVVLEALLIVCHEEKESVHVGEVADLANGILELRGDGYRLEPRRVGSIMSSFSLGQRRDSRGYGLILSTECNERIHQLARSLDAPFFQGEIEKCDICANLPPLAP
jgi:hypothetical protein